MLLDNATVVVTGAGRGIGRAISLALVPKVSRVVGLDVDADALAETAAAAGKAFVPRPCDITSSSDLASLREWLEKEGCGLQVLVNNAGVPASGPYLGQPFDVWARTVEINLLGLMRTTYELLPLLKASSPARIVNISSVAGKFGTEGLVAYAAAKHGVVGFSSSLRAELSGSGVGVSCVCPIFTRTRFLDKFKANSFTPLVDPEDVSRAVLRAILDNPAEVFVPGSQRLWSSILPALFPGLCRWAATKGRMSGNWMEIVEGPGRRDSQEP